MPDIISLVMSKSTTQVKGRRGVWRGGKRKQGEEGKERKRERERRGSKEKEGKGRERMIKGEKGRIKE